MAHRCSLPRTPSERRALVLVRHRSRLHRGGGSHGVAERRPSTSSTSTSTGEPIAARAAMEIASLAAPSHASDDGLATWLASYLAAPGEPRAAMALATMNRQINVSHAFPLSYVPTLLIAKTEDVEFPLDAVRVAHLAPSRVRDSWRSPATQHFSRSASDWMRVEEIETVRERVPTSGSRGSSASLGDGAVHRHRRLDRAGLPQLGDQAWKAAARAAPRDRSSRTRPFRGREIDTAGDGFFATFDGPGARRSGVPQAIVELVGPRHRGPHGPAHRGVRGDRWQGGHRGRDRRPCRALAPHPPRSCVPDREGPLAAPDSRSKTPASTS